MGESPETRHSLLVRVRDARDGEAWSEFVEIYAPLIYGFGRKQGLQDADAADLVQDVLRSVARAISRWPQENGIGSFRGCLFTIARNKLRDFLQGAARRVQGSGDSSIQRLLDNQPAAADEVDWNNEYEQRVFQWAAQQVRQQVQDSTWQAFWLSAVEGREGKDVARRLGLTVPAVYLAKSRVMAKVKERVRSVVNQKETELPMERE